MVRRIFTKIDEVVDDGTTSLIVRGLDGKLHPVYGIEPSPELPQKNGWRDIPAIEKHVAGRVNPIFLELEE